MKTLADRYRLDYAIGAGGVGIVWRARDLRRQRMVAIKEVRLPEALEGEERAALTTRAIREARAAARLEHPNVLPVLDVVIDEGLPWVIMELVEGESLIDRVRTGGPLAPADAGAVGLALLDALEAAHAAGVVHGDVKPANVMIRADGTPLLTDFALAATLGDGVPLGDPAYVAPERRLTGDGGPAADLFSLGATLAFATDSDDPALTAVIKSLTDGDPRARPSLAAARAALEGQDPASVPHEPSPSDPAPAPAAETPDLAPESQLPDPAPGDEPLETPAAESTPPVGPPPPAEPSTAAEPTPWAAATAAPSTQAPPTGTPSAQAQPATAPAAQEQPAAGAAAPAEAPRKRRWSEPKTAALVGAGVLAILVAIGTLGHENAPAPAEHVAASASPSSSPSDDPTSPVPADAPPLPGPSTSPSPSVKSPAPRSTRTKTTSPSPSTEKPAILSAEITTNPATYTGPCGGNGLDIDVTITITATPANAAITYAATGHGTQTVTAAGGKYSTTYRVRIDSHRSSVQFALNVTSPATAGDTSTMTNNCTR
ncbi:serine/threonine-protein kinase [Dactylosporangium sp. NPDC051485]|uniref:serine/threonine-protein kinase n=1 Tax=Dactylosporangium sp. NPDC051485 TaxID=3154846 RepID=UPI003434B509